MYLKQLKYNWEIIARTAPLWGICNDPSRRFNGWKLEEIFLSGETEISAVINYLESLGLHLDFSQTALDFGCGIGRLTQALAKLFKRSYGIDISSEMVTLANKYNQFKEKCIYTQISSDRLDMFGDNTFSFIYSSLVLQHIANKYATKYIKEFIRILKPGGVLIFQMPSAYTGGKRTLVSKLRDKVQLRTRIKRLFSTLGLSKPKIQDNNFSIEMHCMPVDKISHIIKSCNADIIDIVNTNSADTAFNGKLLYLKQDKPYSNYVSKQYCIIK